MIRNYLKIALRAIWRNKAHSLINILGLSLGIACCLLITLFVKDEWTFDRFHSKVDRIYRAYAIEDWGENQKFFDTTTPFPMGPALKDNFQEVEHMVRINNIATQVRLDDKLFSESVMIAGTSMFEVFDFVVLQGDRSSILSTASNVALTETQAIKLFGTTDVLGKAIQIQLAEKLEDFTVRGIIADPPTNSSINFSMVIADLNYPKLYSERALTSSWFNITPETYVLLREDADRAALEKKFPALFKTLLGDDYEKSKYFVGLQPLAEIHLDPSFPVAIAPVADPRYSYILAGIAVLILAVACINFVTLSIGRSLKRAREVGIRKVVGAMRSQLITQFVGEAVLITLFSLVVGGTMAMLCLPLFNEMAGKQLKFEPNMFLAGALCALVAIIGLFAGSYPAFVLSGFRPVSILKGNVQHGASRQTLRKVLVGVQVVLSIFLVSSTLLMNKQLSFIQDKNLGFNREQLIVVPVNVNTPGRLAERMKAGFEKSELLKTEFAKLPGVIESCAAAHDFGNGGWTNAGYTDEKGTYRVFNVNIVDPDYIQTMKMELAQGRNFSADNAADYSKSIIVNEAFVREYGWNDPIGKRIPGKNFVDHEVIAVVKDFNYASLYSKVEPLVLALDPKIPFSGIENINFGNSPIPKVLVRVLPGSMATTVDNIRGAWDKLTGGEEFNFSFADETIATQYRADLNLGRIVKTASLLAILIGSLGLYGLASLALQNRVKEISVRKVFGATERSLMILLSKEYVVLIVICLILSIPATVYLMQTWLSTFEYRIKISADVFLLAGGISITIAMMTISYQVVRTAWVQPAESLKHE